MPNEYRHSGNSQIDGGQQAPSGVAASAAPSEYQTTLIKIIESTTNDPRQLRRLVYELARANLKKETWQREPALGPAEVRACMVALETAIERVETDLSGQQLPGVRFPRLDGDQARLAAAPQPPALPDLQPARSTPQATDLDAAEPAVRDLSDEEPHTGAVALRPRPRLALRPELDEPLRAAPARIERPQVEIVYPESETPAARVRRRVWLWFVAWPFIQLAGLAIFTVLLYMALAGRLDLQGAQTRQVVEQQGQLAAEGTAAVHPSGLPLPTSYGVFAVSAGQLNELAPLPIKAPDPRVALSAEIKTPSATLLPDGRVVFIVFRRDLLNSAPQRASIRVVARVAHATTLTAGKTTRTDLDASWRIRNNSYDFKVAPLPENHEMIAIRPEADDFVLPAGRYALVLDGTAFDFTVNGPVTADAQCLESFETVNGPIYNECRIK